MYHVILVSCSEPGAAFRSKIILPLKKKRNVLFPRGSWKLLLLGNFNYYYQIITFISGMEDVEINYPVQIYVSVCVQSRLTEYWICYQKPCNLMIYFAGGHIRFKSKALSVSLCQIINTYLQESIKWSPLFLYLDQTPSINQEIELLASAGKFFLKNYYGTKISVSFVMPMKHERNGSCFQVSCLFILFRRAAEYICLVLNKAAIKLILITAAVEAKYYNTRLHSVQSRCFFLCF